MSIYVSLNPFEAFERPLIVSKYGFDRILGQTSLSSLFPNRFKVHIVKFCNKYMYIVKPFYIMQII